MTAQEDFTFPSLYAFPPFFTPQPNPQTLESQETAWSKLILDYCQAKRRFSLDAASEEDLNSELFYNREIDRRISALFVKALLARLVRQGSAAWDATGGKKGKTEQNTRAIIYWRKPEEWGELIYSWVKETGQNKSILTFFELTEGDLAQQTAEHRKLPTPVLRAALAHLAKTGRCQVFAGEEGLTGGEGVKFV
ncbi:ESCRT-II complex, vps25 subunit [Tilletiaria anomala UBC 951]|uniref:ESCRT-II complex subunit VPS25 n=1 Tax=Tilletiaria anomala (strain ATCC 24038 / CBS 436.72 / UBC 951) TaxID=1037660 RepID=A0A066VQC7_TILAU|nr:ESCRT-II complex, vps25 subunit [Tilletiaria anomala UBC 951]KDN40780.1 ESCRT-II complex, vps25 subunit [Tilletiaria anomala UBC 951]